MELKLLKQDILCFADIKLIFKNNPDKIDDALTDFLKCVLDGSFEYWMENECADSAKHFGVYRDFVNKTVNTSDANAKKVEYIFETLISFLCDSVGIPICLDSDTKQQIVQRIYDDPKVPKPEQTGNPISDYEKARTIKTLFGESFLNDFLKNSNDNGLDYTATTNVELLDVLERLNEGNNDSTIMVNIIKCSKTEDFRLDFGTYSNIKNVTFRGHNSPTVKIDDMCAFVGIYKRSVRFRDVSFSGDNTANLKNLSQKIASVETHLFEIVEQFGENGVLHLATNNSELLEILETQNKNSQEGTTTIHIISDESNENFAIDFDKFCNIDNVVFNGYNYPIINIENPQRYNPVAEKNISFNGICITDDSILVSVSGSNFNMFSWQRLDAKKIVGLNARKSLSGSYSIKDIGQLHSNQFKKYLINHDKATIVANVFSSFDDCMNNTSISEWLGKDKEKFPYIHVRIMHACLKQICELNNIYSYFFETLDMIWHSCKKFIPLCVCIKCNGGRFVAGGIVCPDCSGKGRVIKRIMSDTTQEQFNEWYLKNCTNNDLWWREVCRLMKYSDILNFEELVAEWN